MADPARQNPTVAHFRSVWFEPTETFLHNIVANCSQTRPVLIGLETAHADDFPFGGPIVSLFPRGSRQARWQGLRCRWLGPEAHPHFDTRRTHRALARFEARLLHAHFGFTGYQLLAVKRRCGLPLVTSFYGVDVSRPAREPAWAARYRELFEVGECFLVEGPHMRQRLIEIGCPPEKTALQPIAIDPRRYPLRPRPAKRGREPVRILFCARLCEKKGALDALEAVARVKPRYPSLELRVAGDGPLRPRLEETLDRRAMRGYTELLGFVSHARMIDHMDAADLFIQPSVTAADGDSEGGAPTTLLEAQACGLPVLATRHADIPNVVVEGQSALLCAEGDVEGLAANLLALLEDPGRWAEMGRRGREKVERHHDVAVEVARLEDRYRALLEPALPGSPMDV